MNLEGRLLGNRYEIIEKIGSGGMATVYKARCNVLNRYVAIKILREEFTTDNDFIKRFKAEAQSAASLTHPNIVSIYDVANEKDLHYIVMELVQGKTLKQIINEDGILSWKWSLNIVTQIASALEMAHKNNIIHRDIKPHNIIITEDGVAKVTDFGIAKAVSNSTITAFGTTIGSVHYFSPEHAKGGFTDAKSDLYSLGVVLYEMVTGRVPFDADTPVSVALKHMQETPVEPKDINPLLPKAVNDIIMKSMQKDASLRYATATEIIKDCNLVLQNPELNLSNIRITTNEFPTQIIDTKKYIKEDIKEDKKIEPKRQEKREFVKESKENKETTFSKKKIIIGILIAIILFISSILLGFFVLNNNTVKDVEIPDLVGKTEAEAQETLKKLNLVYEVSERKYDSEVESGKIISQNPEFQVSHTGEAYKIKENSTIKVVVSSGKEMVKISDVAGKTQEEALQELSKLNILVEVQEETSEKIEAGFITRQEPASGQEVEAGSKVILYVSIGRGIKEVKVPNLLGKTEAEALAAIEEADLVLNTTITEEDASKDNGIIIKQDLTPGTTVDEKTPITITVNRVPELKTGKVKINLKSITNYQVEYEDVKKETTVPKETTVVTTKPTDGTIQIGSSPTATTQAPSTTTKVTTMPIPTTIIEKKEKAPNEVNVKVKIGTETFHNEKHKQNEENIEVEVSGFGTVTVSILVDDVVKKQGQLNLNSENPVLEIK